ncbi:uncharacterized protein TRAVEDRAFT_150970 [Trametes versicolor FP-101664 SS1]|uniref:uncharacterized protein n=1 Tax=Trametes versicolor (strain FP-101664) TaxID=717944 RepID=UPI00046213A2|nr:uncharacterized protein TRAVEDRAFT_150970 [Trametes versicolor FP-101664 SS1]EIW56426.1 hypothetical protein TRAVEDRAFT_150970 [Trametes versicolor FP-101664 SS1]
MNKTQFYLSQCAEAASKSHMCFTLGAIMVKGGKVMSSGYNHHRPHYDGSDVRTHGHRKPVSMHAEMHAIFSFTGMSPSFKTQVQGLERRGQKGLRAPKTTLLGPPPSPTISLSATTSPSPPPTSTCKGSVKGKSKQRPRTSSRHSSPSRLSGGGGSSSGEEYSGSESPSLPPGGHSRSSTSLCGVPVGATRISPPKETDKLWDSRRRDSRANGADIYVARFTKNGFGSAKPCWRCLEWCRWAGVKRIFHWNAEEGKFDVVKVNSAESGQYETHADIRLFAGLGWCP